MKKFNNKENEKINHNGKEVWLSRHVAVTSAIICELNGTAFIAVVKRGSATNESGKWCMPCGFLDWDETAAEAFIRETYEESGIDIEDLVNNNKVEVSFLSDQPWYVSTDPAHSRSQNVTLHFSGMFIVDKLPKVTNRFAAEDEIDKVEWIKVSEEAIQKKNWAFNHDSRIRQLVKSMQSIEELMK